MMFLLLFTFVFGGAVLGTTQDYLNYIVPGIFVQVVLFGAIQTSVGLAEDLSKGMTDRMRSLPISRTSLLAARTIADALRNVAVGVILITVAYLLGYSFSQGFINGILGLFLAVLFGYCISWISVVSALYAKNAEIANSLGFVFIFPLVFASSAFVPISTMPSWLQGFATYQPVSVTITAVRSLTLSGPNEFILYTFLWIALLLTIFIPLSTYLYARKQ
jgi:ABC-2 type transport system permease protein/oleandomycin transport system permease protein